MRKQAVWKIVKNLGLIILVLFGIWFLASMWRSSQHLYDSKYKQGFDEYNRQAEKNR